MIEKLYGDLPSYGKSYFTEKVDEMYDMDKSLSVGELQRVIEQTIKKRYKISMD